MRHSEIREPKFQVNTQIKGAVETRAQLWGTTDAHLVFEALSEMAAVRKREAGTVGTLQHLPGLAEGDGMIQRSLKWRRLRGQPTEGKKPLPWGPRACGVEAQHRTEDRAGRAGNPGRCPSQ